MRFGRLDQRLQFGDIAGPLIGLGQSSMGFGCRGDQIDNRRAMASCERRVIMLLRGEQNIRQLCRYLELHTRKFSLSERAPQSARQYVEQALRKPEIHLPTPAALGP